MRRQGTIDKINRYIKLINIARMEGNKVEERRLLLEWIGIAKLGLDLEQGARLLYDIYKSIEDGGYTPEPLAENFIIDTYAKEI